MTLLNPIPFRLTDSAGNPINGGTLTAYVSGTTTLPISTPTAAARHRSQIRSPATTTACSPTCSASRASPTTSIGRTRRARCWTRRSAGTAPRQLTSRSTARAARPAPIPKPTGYIVRRTYAGTMTDTLPDSVAPETGKTVTIWNDGDGGISVQVSGGGTIDGSATRVIAQGDRVKFISRGAEWTADGAP